MRARIVWPWLIDVMYLFGGGGVWCGRRVRGCSLVPPAKHGWKEAWVCWLGDGMRARPFALSSQASQRAQRYFAPPTVSVLPPLLLPRDRGNRDQPRLYAAAALALLPSCPVAHG